MNSRDDMDARNGSPREHAGSRHSAARRQLAHAMAERERGHRKLNSVTATVSFASVIVAGVVAAVLPGSSHAATTQAGKSGSSSTSSPASNSSTSTGTNTSTGTSTPSNSNSSSSSGSGFQPPAQPPVQYGGGGGVSSGGS